jgi:hypothetical protein
MAYGGNGCALASVAVILPDMCGKSQMIAILAFFKFIFHKYVLQSPMSFSAGRVSPTIAKIPGGKD